MMQWHLPPNRRPRSPLAQVAIGVIGVALIIGIGLFALGTLAVIAVVMAIAVTLRRFFPPSPNRPTTENHASKRVEPDRNSQVIDGEFEVIDNERRL
ncbi:MAG: hypothetical protein ABIR16_07070 [Dokdonella sp.]